MYCHYSVSIDSYIGKALVGALYKRGVPPLYFQNIVSNVAYMFSSASATVLTYRNKRGHKYRDNADPLCGEGGLITVKTPCSKLSSPRCCGFYNIM